MALLVVSVMLAVMVLAGYLSYGALLLWGLPDFPAVLIAVAAGMGAASVLLIGLALFAEHLANKGKLK
jgi:hypothetical protein